MSLMSVGVLSLCVCEEGGAFDDVGLEQDLGDEFGGDFDEFDEFGGHSLCVCDKRGCV